MTYIVGLSGPPRSGKDSIGGMLAAVIEDRHGKQPQLMSLSIPMRLTVYALLGLPYSVPHYEQHKDEPQDLLGGKSIRQAMITLSEEWVKPTYGKAFWVRRGIATVWPLCPVVIITDMGFDIEVQELEKWVGPSRCVWAHLERDGRDFSNDSRSHVGNSRYVTKLPNTSTIEEAATRLYGRLVNQFHWQLD